MSSGPAIAFILVLALFAANLPFVSQRLFGLVRWTRPQGKPLSIRLAELALAYLLVGVVALAFEHRMGRIAPQGWEFYAVTICLFLSFAFPGFVYRYLFRRRADKAASHTHED